MKSYKAGEAWGGSGDPGFGREHGDVAIENFTEPKAVWLALDS